MAPITLNEGLAWFKTLKRCHEELIAPQLSHPTAALGFSSSQQHCEHAP